MSWNKFVRRMSSLFTLLLLCLLAQSCSLGMPAEQKKSIEAMELLGKTLGQMPFKGPTQFLTCPLEGGWAIAFYPDADSGNKEIDKYYAFWIRDKSVYTVNREAMSFYPSLPQSPPEIGINRVVAALTEENGVILRPEP